MFNRRTILQRTSNNSCFFLLSLRFHRRQSEITFNYQKTIQNVYWVSLSSLPSSHLLENAFFNHPTTFLPCSNRPVPLPSLEEDIADYGYDYSDDEEGPSPQTPTLVAEAFQRLAGGSAPGEQVGLGGSAQKKAEVVEDAPGVAAGILEFGGEMAGERLGEKPVVGERRPGKEVMKGSEDQVIADANLFWSAPAEYLGFGKR